METLAPAMGRPVDLSEIFPFSDPLSIFRVAEPATDIDRKMTSIASLNNDPGFIYAVSIVRET
jgi:hypothetical protein